MNINKSLSKLFSAFLVVTLLLSSVATAIAATTDTPEWLSDEFLDEPFTPLTPEERAAQRALADAKAEADRVAAAEKAAADLRAAEAAEAAKRAEEARLAEKAAANAVEQPAVVEQPVAPTVVAPTSEPITEETTATEQLNNDQTTTEQTAPSQSSTSTDQSTSETNSVSESSTETVAPAGTSTAEVRDAIETVLTDELAKGESVEVNLGGGQTAIVSSEEEVRKLLQIAATTGQTTNDLNGNGLDDAFEVQETGRISFDEISKTEAVKKTVYGDIAPGQSVIVSVPEAIAEDTASEQVVGDKPFLKTRIEPKSGEKAVENDQLEFKVYDENGKLVDSQTVIVDENGVATYEPKIALSNGRYSITTTNKVGKVIAKKDIAVDATKVPTAPEFKLNDRVSISEVQLKNKVAVLSYAQASVLGATEVSGQEFDIVQYLLKSYIYKFYPYLDPSEKDAVAAAGIEVTQGEVPKVIEGDAAPGTVVYVTWKSIVGYSVVIADAKGKFKAEAPADLAKGNHSVIAFVYDPKNNLVGNATSLLFKK